MIGETIKRMREERGWTPEPLAEEMGYTSKSTINKIEKNINDVGQRKTQKFAQVFGCDVTDLLVENTGAYVEPLSQKYDEKQIERAMKFLEQYDSAIPEIQGAVRDLLKVHQSDS